MLDEFTKLGNKFGFIEFSKNHI